MRDFFNYFWQANYDTMGGAASTAALLDGASDDRKRQLMGHMRTIYEDATSKGLSDREVSALLDSGLSNLLSPSLPPANQSEPPGSPERGPNALSAAAQKLKPTGLKKGTIPSPGGGNGSGASDNSLRSGAAGGASVSSRPKVQRRRSYGVKETNKIVGKNGAAGSKQDTSLLGSLSEAHIGTSGVSNLSSPTSNLPPTNSATFADALAADHWDSVRELPYCPLCAMAFKSVSLLERHIKYSDIHLKAIVAQTAEAAKTTEQAVVEAPKTLPRQVEGQDYKLLYFGSKFFWRSQDNIDLSFFHHIACSVIEVVPFDVYKNAELERLYFDLYIIHENIDADVETKLSELKEQFKHDNKHDKFQSATFNDVHERAQLTRVAMTTYILTRLQLHTIVNEGSKSTAQLRFQESTQSFSEKTPVLLPEQLPKILIPVSVTHRRNTSTEEVKQKLTELADDQAALKSAINKAEIIASMVHRFASLYSSRKELQMYSIPRRRWILAIRKVVQINAVIRVRAMLRIREEARAKNESPGRRKRGQSMYRKEV